MAEVVSLPPSSRPPAKVTPLPSANRARARLQMLCDPGSFDELGSTARHQETAFGLDGRRPPGDGVVTGTARVGGRSVAVFSQDVTALGGSLGQLHAEKICRVLDYADRTSSPVIGLLDSGGARIQEGVGALDGYGSIFARNVRLSGRVPQISVVLGTCAGGAVYSPALTDAVIMSEAAHMFLTGPAVVKAVTREDVTAAELGGPGVHSASGVAHLVAPDDLGAIRLAQQLLDYLPDSSASPLPHVPSRGPSGAIELPEEQRQVYDVRTVIAGIVDADSVLELQPSYARNIVTALARIEGCPVGVVANQPFHLAGTLNSPAAEKAARFVRMCDAYGIPILTLVDTPGYLPGTREEKEGVIRRGAKLLYAYAEAEVPRVTVVLRKAFGGAYIVMGSRSLGADRVLSLPGAELAVMGADGAVDVIFRRDLQRDPESRASLVERYRTEAMAPQLACDQLSVDEVVRPDEVRARVAASLRSLAGALQPRHRHDNLPQ